MTRTFPINAINEQWSFRQPLSVTQRQDETGWVAQCAELPHIEGRAKAWPEAFQDFRDNLMASLDIGDPRLMALLTETAKADVAKPSATTAAPAKGRVFVLTEDGKVVGVTASAEWASRWEKWNPKGGSVECEMEVLP